jgi:hypothetical protein
LVEQTQRKLKTNFFRWQVNDRAQNLLTGRFIYSMIIPLLITDFFVSCYQTTSFPICGVQKLRRANYIIF